MPTQHIAADPCIRSMQLSVSDRQIFQDCKLLKTLQTAEIQFFFLIPKFGILGNTINVTSVFLYVHCVSINPRMGCQLKIGFACFGLLFFIELTMVVRPNDFFFRIPLSSTVSIQW